MGYIIVKARLPGIYDNVNRPCPRAAPSDSGRFTAINPWPRPITITNTMIMIQALSKTKCVQYTMYYGLL